MLVDNTIVVPTISSLIQLSVAPVFLLAGVAGLLNVFIGRLARIIDKLEKLDDIENKTEKNINIEDLKKRKSFLIMRMKSTNLAIFFTTATGLMVALVIITIFLSTLLSYNGEVIISILFVLSMVSLVIALILFLREIYFTTFYVKES